MPTAPLVLSVDRSAPVSLPVQIADQIRSAVRAGALRVGDRLPGSRVLAAEIGVSRAVVEQAYDQLHAEGWVSGRHGSGTFVHDIAAGMAAPVRRAPTGPPDPVSGRRALVSLDGGSPWRDPRHDAGWRRAWREVSSAKPPATYPAAAGLPELRAAVAAHVSRHRGIACSVDEVVITNGTTHGLDLLMSTVPPGTLAMEDPGYRATAAVAVQRGWRILDVPVDDEGLEVAALREVPDEVHAVYTTPAHQHPLGMTLSPQRRRELLAECARRDALVVEDDYDSEFRYDVAPLPALAQLGLERVVYLGTTSKAVIPGLRLGWLVTSAERAAQIVAARRARHDHTSWPVQRAFVAMLRDGYVDRLLRSARRVYAERSREVTRRLAPFGRLDGGVAGMYTVLHLPPERTRLAVAAAARAGYRLPTLESYCRSARLSGIMVGFGAVTDRQLDEALTAVERALGESRR